VGWRYVGTRTEASSESSPESSSEFSFKPNVVAGSVDVTVDARWRPLRVEVRSGAHVVRAGLTAAGLAWVRDGIEGAADAAALASSSPATLVVRARLVGRAGGPVGVGACPVLRVLRLDGPALAPLSSEERWTLVEVVEHQTDLGPLTVRHWVVDDLVTGERAEAHLAGDVVLAAQAHTWSVTLEDLDGPPTPW
jgi:hypothetical protein